MEMKFEYEDWNYLRFSDILVINKWRKWT